MTEIEFQKLTDIIREESHERRLEELEALRAAGKERPKSYGIGDYEIGFDVGFHQGWKAAVDNMESTIQGKRRRKTK